MQISTACLLLNYTQHIATDVTMIRTFNTWYLQCVVICSAWLSAVHGYPQCMVICSAWLSVVHGYLQFMVISGELLPGVHDYLQRMIICRAWVSLHRVRICIATGLKNPICNTWLSAVHGYLQGMAVCSAWASAVHGYLQRIGICSAWVSAAHGYLQCVVICSAWVYICGWGSLWIT